MTPARSAHNPPKPAINSGMAKRSVAPEVPGDEISMAPVMFSTIEITKKTRATISVMRAGDLKSDFTLPVGSVGFFNFSDISWPPSQQDSQRSRFQQRVVAGAN